MKRSVASTEGLFKRREVRPRLSFLSNVSASKQVDYNPFLTQADQGSSEPAKGSIERIDSAANLVWQSRRAAPTDYELRLGDALEQAFEDGASTPAELVARLNSLNVLRPDGQPWDEAAFLAEMRQLGA